MNFAERITTLKTRASAIGEALAGLTARRAALALAAAEGDKTPEAEIARLDRDGEALASQYITFNAALDQLAKAEEEAAAEAETTRRREIEAQAHTLASAILTKNKEIDAALFALTDIFEIRADLLNQLRATRTVPSNLIARLASRSCGTAAARAANLQRFLDLEPVGPGNILTLSEAGQGALSGPLVVQGRP